ncbi:hypothetical protein [Bdellovibrio sp. HCB337]|uniref:hypothetical protein n=1 Tax=Bdellovibrio sp. HCB337 TaxID=3394358 RepID=UPI0039A611EA
MDDLKVGSLILAALFGLPGYLFVQILTKYSFKTSRPGASKTVLLLASFVGSTVLVCLFDSEQVRHIISEIFFKRYSPFDVQTESQYLFSTTRFSTELLDALFKNQTPRNINTLLVSYLAYLTTFSVVLAVLLSICLNFLTGFSKLSFDGYIIGFIHFVEYTFRKIKRACTTEKAKKHKLNQKLGLAASQGSQSTRQNLGHWRGRIIAIYQTLGKGINLILAGTFLILVVSFFILFLLMIWGSQFLAWVIDILLFVYHRAMSLFRHPSEEIFEPIRFKERSGVPIVEVYTHNEKINKGIFVSFLPKSSEEIGSITLRSVIQYSKDNQKHFFDRSSRKVYEFPNRYSLYTIGSESFHDLNVSYLKYKDFEWNFKITGPASIINQRWYLRIILEEHRCLFDFNKFNAWVDVRFAPHFFLEILKLLDQSFPRFYHVYKLKTLTYDMLDIWRQYRKDLKQKITTFSPKEQEDILKAQRELASYLWKMRKRFRALR